MVGLSIRGVTKEFPTRAGPLAVLRGVSLSLESGDRLAILGPSGSGKTTLLMILGTLERPTTGAVRLGDVDPFQLDERELAAFRRDQIGLVFQDHHLLPQCSVLENVLLPSIAGGRASPEAVARARGLLDRVGLADRLEHRPSELSGGERQRVAVARALVGKPKLVLADEPTGNLDRTTARSVGQLLVDLQAEQQWILIVVTHSIELAERFSERRRLDEGRLMIANR